eukprot:344497_1
MAEAVYTHKHLTIKCCIESYASTVKTNPITIRMKSASNDDYLQNLMTKIRRKFKFLDNLDDAEWDMQIGGDIVDKENANQLQVISWTKRMPTNCKRYCNAHRQFL